MPSPILLPFQWFLPSLHGDICLTAKSPTETELRAFALSPTERKALRALRSRAVHGTSVLRRSPWCAEAEFDRVFSPVDEKEGTTITLQASVKQVHAVLAKAMKPDRELLTAVRYVGGSIEEIRARETTPEGDSAPAVEVPDRTKPAATAPPPKKPEAERAVTVAAPTIGCPMPDFGEADIRASRVLSAFLTPEQVRDYERFGSFIVTGADTGHRYMVAHRERPHALRQCGFRQLYDLEEQRALCVHDWTVPAPEEMLAIALCVTLPGRERLVREMPEVWSS